MEEEVRHGDIQRFEAACARGQCDLVLHGSAVAWRLGTTAAAELELGWLFGRPVVVTSGRLSPAEIAVEGRLSPLVQDARKEAESPTGLSPFLFVGTVAKDKIGQLILTNLPGVQACYSALLSESPDAAGRVTMKWVIGADGRVSWVGPDNPEIRDPRFLACLSSVIRSLRFPEPEGGQVGFVRYPFAFTPG